MIDSEMYQALQNYSVEYSEKKRLFFTHNGFLIHSGNGFGLSTGIIVLAQENTCSIAEKYQSLHPMKSFISPLSRGWSDRVQP